MIQMMINIFDDRDDDADDSHTRMVQMTCTKGQYIRSDVMIGVMLMKKEYDEEDGIDDDDNNINNIILFNTIVL